MGQVQQKTEKESIIESAQRQGEASDLKVLANIAHKYESPYEKTSISICKNKDADQLCCNCMADQRLCFCNTERAIPLLKSTISSFKHSSVTPQSSLCPNWSETPDRFFV